MEPLHVAVTGAAGQIGYSLLFRLASGEVFGPDVPIKLHLLEVPAAVKAVEGVAMELCDGAFPALMDIEIFDDPEKGFDGVSWAVLVGAAPRSEGMSRGDLLKKNGPIFVTQGKALLKAARDIRCVVVGNPCNTNALITLSQCRDIPTTRFFAMTTLDENRAKYQIAQKAKVSIAEVKNLTIWGNHSSTMVPDYENAQIRGEPLLKTITDLPWLQNTFFKSVQERGAAIIKARGKSSAASAASSCLDLMRYLHTPTPPLESFSVGVFSEYSPYSFDKSLVYSFPIRTLSSVVADYEIIPRLKHSSFLHEKLKASEQELLKEKHDVEPWLGPK